MLGPQEFQADRGKCLASDGSKFLAFSFEASLTAQAGSHLDASLLLRARASSLLCFTKPVPADWMEDWAMTDDPGGHASRIMGL